MNGSFFIFRDFEQREEIFKHLEMYSYVCESRIVFFAIMILSITNSVTNVSISKKDTILNGICEIHVTDEL